MWGTKPLVKQNQTKPYLELPCYDFVVDDPASRGNADTLRRGYLGGQQVRNVIDHGVATKQRGL
jgi:hypothetical protein